ncbi:MAG: OsmC family protein [Steroidobacterales bacterium]
MAQYSADVIWERGDAVFTDNRYSRRHRWRFDGGLEVPGSSSPHSVPVPLSDPAALDPEEAFVAALSSCHMLWFLSIAVKRGFRIDRYRDQAAGIMEKNADGNWCISTVTLRPDVQFSGKPLPTREQIEAMHHSAHEECYIAHSVSAQIRIEPVWSSDAPAGKPAVI